MLNKIHILGSSSAGNTYLLYFSNKKIIQLDAGCKLKPEELNKVNRLYITHNHSDHTKYLKDFYKRDGNKEDFIIINPSEPSQEYKAVRIPHAVENYAYIINEDDEKIAYITDCGDWSKLDLDLSDCTYLFIECNWDYFLIKQGIVVPQPHAVYAFSKEGHMSNLDCLNAIAKWKVNKDCKIILIHKSQDHANYDSTYKMFCSLPNKVAIAPREDGTIWCKAWTYTGDERGRILK